MITPQITLDEQAIEAIREEAELSGKTPEVWVAEVAAQRAVATRDKRWVDELLERAGKSRGDSKGWKWNRQELYER
jgi:hypothetical protein